MTDLDKIWDHCLNTMESQNIVSDKVIFDTFFRSATLASLDNNIATILTAMAWNKKSILEKKVEIESILTSLLSINIEIQVLSEEEYNDSIKNKTTEKETIIDNLNKNLTFDDFVVGSSNRMAQNAALIVSTNPGANFNPLFIYSNPGLGKTHLLHSIGNYAKQSNPDLNIRYVTSKEFVDEVVKGMRNIDEIYEKYKTLDILLIDDIQFLFQKEKSSEMFFHIFNSIINNNKQIVITSDKKPEELQGIEDRLISRFQSGLSFGIDPPEFETAKAILEKKIENLDNPQLIIKEDVIDFLATNYCHDIRSLEGSLKRLFFCSIMHFTNVIDMNFVLDAFKDDKIIKDPTTKLTTDCILKTTAEFYYLSTTQLISKNKTQKLATPREIAMYLMRELLDITFSEIGMAFSGRDHSTIMKACARVEEKIKKDKDYRLAITKIKEKL